MCELREAALSGASSGLVLGWGDGVSAIGDGTVGYRRVKEREHNAPWASVWPCLELRECRCMRCWPRDALSYRAFAFNPPRQDFPA